MTDTSSTTDEALYGVYSRAVALITQRRLTHWHSIDAFITLRENPPASSSPSSPSPPPFLQELATWRNISTYAPQASLQASKERPVGDGDGVDEDGAAAAMHVPSMVLDVVLDPAQLAQHEDLTLVKCSQRSRSRSAVPVENLIREQRQSTASPATSPRPIVLERWRIDFSAFPPEDPPSRDALARDFAALFAALTAFSSSLPAQRLHDRLSAARIQAEARRDPPPSRDHLLQIGCRLGAGDDDEGEGEGGDNDDDDDGPDEIGLRVKLSLSRSSDADADAADDVADDAEDAELETSIHGFPPVITPLGSLSLSVEYRNNVDFAVRSAREHVEAGVEPSGIASIELKPDEDFFRPKAGGAAGAATGAAEIKAQTASSAPLAVPTTPAPAVSTTPAPRKVSALSVLRQQSNLSGVAGGAGVAGVTSVTSVDSPSGSSPSPSASPSLFSTSATQAGRPVAGLSSLRTQSSAPPIATNTEHAFATSGRSTTTTTSSSSSSSPGPAEPAFITPHHNRRPSMTERRFRTLSGLGSVERASPPSPPTQAVGTTPPMRPAGALSAHMRFGSYSPSSPSPLAQQMSSTSGGGVAQRHPYSTSYGYSGQAVSPAAQRAGGGGGPAASTTTPLAVGSPNFSLRSIFQEYGPQKPSPPGARSSSAASSSSITSLPAVSSRVTSATHLPFTAASPSPSPRPAMPRRVSGAADASTDTATPTSTDDHRRDSSSSSSIVTGTYDSASRDSRDSRHSPTVAPRMIERYARTPSYRQERRATGGSIGDSHAEGSSSIGGGGASGSYSKSWQARTEARQAMIANAMQRGSLGSAGSGGGSGGGGSAGGGSAGGGSAGGGSAGGGSGSPGSLYGRGSPPVSTAQKRLSTQPQPPPSHRIHRKGSIDEFMAMIESRPQLGSPRIAASKRPGPTPTQVKQPHEGDDDQRQQRIGSTSSAYGSTSASALASTSASASASASSSRLVLSPSAIDDMLAKMSLSVHRLTAREGASAADAARQQGEAPQQQQQQQGRPPAAAPSGGATGLSFEGGRGARVYDDGSAVVVGGGSGGGTSVVGDRAGGGRRARGGGAMPTMPPPPGTLPRLTMNRSQSSFELSAPDHPQQQQRESQHPRSSSAFDDEQDFVGGHYDEEEPAGRLELHSEPSTPHPITGGSVAAAAGGGVNIGDAFAAAIRRHGSDGLDTNANERSGDIEIEGGLGGLGSPTTTTTTTTMSPSDAQRLRTFGEELGSTRGRRTQQSPWGIRRSLTPSGPGAVTAGRQAAGGGGPGAFAMRPSHSHQQARGPVRGFPHQQQQQRVASAAAAAAASSTRRHRSASHNGGGVGGAASAGTGMGIAFHHRRPHGEEQQEGEESDG